MNVDRTLRVRTKRHAEFAVYNGVGGRCPAVRQYAIAPPMKTVVVG